MRSPSKNLLFAGHDFFGHVFEHTRHTNRLMTKSNSTSTASSQYGQRGASVIVENIHNRDARLPPWLSDRRDQLRRL